MVDGLFVCQQRLMAAVPLGSGGTVLILCNSYYIIYILKVCTIYIHSIYIYVESICILYIAPVFDVDTCILFDPREESSYVLMILPAVLWQGQETTIRSAMNTPSGM